MKLNLNENVQDPLAKENFRKLNNTISSDPLMKSDFKFFEIVVPRAVADFTYRHGLQLKPKDVIVTSSIGPGDIFFHYEKFDDTNIMFTTTDACTIRCFIGAYR